MKLRLLIYVICAVVMGLWGWSQYQEHQDRLKAQEHFFAYDFDRPTSKPTGDMFMAGWIVTSDGEILKAGNTDCLIYYIPTELIPAPGMILKNHNRGYFYFAYP